MSRQNQLLPTTEPAQMRILDALALPLSGLRLIEASAGTGKTYTIAMLYVRLVLGHVLGQPERLGQGYLPPDILVLTFTEAAASELRDRIRLRLRDAATAFRQQHSSDALLQALLDDYPPDRHEEAAFVLEQAAQWLDEAAIDTIHAWCLRVLQQHAFDTGSLFAQTLVKDISLLREEAVRDVWRRWFYPLPSSQAEIIQSLLHGPDSVSQQLQGVLSALDIALCRDGRPAQSGWRQALADVLAHDDGVQQCQARVWQIWARDGAEITQLLLTAVAQKQIKGGTYKEGWLLALATDMQDWQAGMSAPAKLDKLAAEVLAANVNKLGVAPEHDWFIAVQDYIEADARRAEARAPLALALLTDISQEVQREMAAQLLQRGEMGFDDLLKRVDAALQGPHGTRLAERLRERYPVALIDEFQDTDPLQFRLFSTLYAGRDDTALLMIGDPKQAIYSFRGADLPTYLRARALAQSPYDTLSTNFRSDANLVDGVNQLFSYAGQWPGGAFADAATGLDVVSEEVSDSAAAHSGLGFYPVQARIRGSCLRQRDSKGRWRKLPAMQLVVPDSLSSLASESARQWLAQQCASQIADWLALGSRSELGFVSQPEAPDASTECTLLRPLGPGDIAILVRKGKEARVMREALQALGIASVYGSDRESVFASVEAEQLQIWLEALADPSDERLLRLALATPALGRDWSELALLRDNERAWEQEVEQLRELSQLWRRQGVLAALRQWLFCHDVPARLLHEEIAGGERALTNFLHLAELLQSAAVSLHGEHALVRYLAHCRETHAHQGDDAIVRLESDSARVRVITLHQSKGLEYPLVCMPFAALPAALHANALRRYHTDDGHVVLDLDNGKDSAASQRAASEQLQEDLRLFYVGLTRARHVLWLAILPVAYGNHKEMVLQQTPWAYVLSGQQRLPAADFGDLLARFLTENPAVTRRSAVDETQMSFSLRPPSSAQQALLQPARHFAGLRGKPWRISSYSGLAREDSEVVAHSASDDAGLANYLELVQVEREQALSGLATLPRGAEIGSFWHLVLEEAAAQRFSTSPAALQVVDDFIRQRCQQRGWDDQCEPLQQALRRWLRYPMPLPEQPSVPSHAQAHSGDATGAVASVALSELQTYQVELEFWLASHALDIAALDTLVTRHTLGGRARPAMAGVELNGLFKGFMDLVFSHHGRYFVADYKSNYLGDYHSDYHAEVLAADVAKHRYDLQYVLYTLALHRLLQARLPDYDYDRHIGGAVYIYLRGWDDDGHGIHVERPERDLIERLDRLFRGEPV